MPLSNFLVRHPYVLDRLCSSTELFLSFLCSYSKAPYTGRTRSSQLQEYYKVYNQTISNHMYMKGLKK